MTVASELWTAGLLPWKTPLQDRKFAVLTLEPLTLAQAVLHIICNKDEDVQQSRHNAPWGGPPRRQSSKPPALGAMWWWCQLGKGHVDKHMRQSFVQQVSKQVLIQESILYSLRQTVASLVGNSVAACASHCLLDDTGNANGDGACMPVSSRQS